MKASRLLLVAAVAPLAAHATITVQDYWNMDQSAAPFTDSVGGANLNNVFGTVSTSTSVKAPGSAGSVLFGGDAGAYSSTQLQAYTDNFVMELWVNPVALPTSGDYSIIADMSNGAPGGGQIGIYNGQWFFGINSVSFTQSGVTALTNTWTNLAFVVNGGVTQEYVNGTLIGSIPAPTFSGLTYMLIGCAGGSGHPFNGYIDQIRYSTFIAGQFSASDLLVNAVPEPSTYGLMGAGVMAAIAVVRRRRRTA